MITQNDDEMNFHNYAPNVPCSLGHKQKDVFLSFQKILVGGGGVIELITSK